MLVHNVFFWMKKNAPKNAAKQTIQDALKYLKSPSVKQIWAGAPAKTPARDVIKMIGLQGCKCWKAAAAPIGSQCRDGDTGHHVFASRRGDKQRGFGILHKISQLGAGIGRVERQPGGTGPHAGQIERNGLRALFHLRRHPVAGLHA